MSRIRKKFRQGRSLGDIVNRVTALMLLCAFSLCFAPSVRAATWLIEAEAAGDGTSDKVVPGIGREAGWKIEEANDASGGAYLGLIRFLSNESKRIACRIPRAGNYRVWVRHYQTVGKPTSFFILFRDENGASAGMRNIDFFPRARNITARPLELPEAPDDAVPEWTWTVVDYKFERPMEGSVSFGPAGGEVSGKVGVDCVIVTDDPDFDPRKNEWSNLPDKPGPMEIVALPKGMRPVLPLTYHSSFFAGAPDRENQIKLCMVHGQTLYRDFPLVLELGFNRDRGWNGGSAEYGIQTMVNPDHGYHVLSLRRELEPPEGRRVSAAGRVNDRRFSLFYQPYRERAMEELREKAKLFFDMEEAERYSIIGESGGVFDYSPYAHEAFQKLLKERFGTIGRLNEILRSDYKSFAEIDLPQRPGTDDNKALWFLFRELNGREMARAAADTIRVLNENCPRQLPGTSLASCLHINSPRFTSTGSICLEDMINIGFAESPIFGYDAYSTEDGFIGCDLEFLMSLIGDREMYNSEGNTHGQCPRIAGRSYWSMIGKGVKGIDTWQLQDHPRGWIYSMWGMLKPDMTPRDKLAAISDANHEVHRLERMLKPARRSEFVKPVALYYSRKDLSLTQPLFGLYGSAINSPYHVYAKLRGLGYPVRWITPRQIRAGELKNVGAVFLVGITYIPGEAAEKLAEWVKAGGCIVGDGWPGAFDEYDRPQETLFEVFGVIPEKTKTAESLTEEEKQILLSEQATPVYGISHSDLDALTADDFHRNVREMFNQRDSEHPVALAAGNWHLSGYDGKHVRVVSDTAEIIGQMMGRPGLVLNAFGKGHALYSAIMLGTLYEAGPVRFEWDSSRTGPGLRNILGAFLRYGGLAPFAEPEMPWGMARKMRIERPLADGKGNLLVGMISVNDGPLQSFPLRMRWPAPAPKLLLAVTGGSRRIEQVPFELKDGMLSVSMPGFDTHAMLLALTDCDPLISLDVAGPDRGIAGLLKVTPNARLTIEGRIWNPSPRKLAAGKVRLHAAAGWSCDQNEIDVGPIEPWGSREISFEVMAPPLCAARALKPLVVKYESGRNISTPATELVWWIPTRE